MGRKMSQTAHGQGNAQSGTLLTSGADAARSGQSATGLQFWPTAGWALGSTIYFRRVAWK